MFHYRDSRLTILILGAFFVLAIVYGIFEARGQIFGPSIEVAKYEAVVHDSLFQISGTASRISKLTMNGHDVAVTEKGDFKEVYVLAPGYNRIVFDAQDSYGRRAQKTLEITYESTSTPPTQRAPAVSTSTPELPDPGLAPKK